MRYKKLHSHSRRFACFFSASTGEHNRQKRWCIRYRCYRIYYYLCRRCYYYYPYIRCYWRMCYRYVYGTCYRCY